jgi:serine/threonine-protein kinase
MGVVFRAQDPALNRPVAIKVLNPYLAADSDLVERFHREARTAANLRHRNIVAIHDIGHAEGLYYIVMEYLEGRSLTQVLSQSGALPVSMVLTIAEQVASALDYIHRRKLVHRDVKSTNIMVDHEQRAVLTDFGLVRALAGSTLTAEGSILGTPQYLAPEQLGGGEIGPWTDLYALGVVVYEILTGRYPYDAEAFSALFFQVLWQSPRPLSSVRPDLPEAVNAVLERALEKKPSNRYPSGATFARELQQTLSTEAGTAVVEPLPSTGKQSSRAAVPKRSARTSGAPPSWLWPVVVGIVLLLPMGVLLLLGNVLPSGSSDPTATVPVAMATATRPPSSTEQGQSTSPAVIRPEATPSPGGVLSSQTATSTDVLPTGTPTGQIPTAVSPSLTPSPPASRGPAGPTATSGLPTVTQARPTTPAVSPTSTYSPVPTTEIRPTRTPITPTDTPITPTDTPITPTDTPITPSEEPTTPVPTVPTVPTTQVIPTVPTPTTPIPTP